MGAEATLQKSIATVARNRGAYVEKNDQTGRGRRGTPDLSICYRGCWMSVEVKIPGARTDKAREQAQHARIHEVRDAGGIAFYATSVEHVTAMLDQIDTEQQRARVRSIGMRVWQPFVPQPEAVTL